MATMSEDNPFLPGSPETESFPSTDEIIKRFGQFRILLAGKSGVGKSTLINIVFNADIASVSHGRAGTANIEREITSDRNNAFVMHDSRGFELGEDDALRDAEDFIRNRGAGSNRPEREKLHAIWLCVAIPIAGGRLFERGDEALIKIAHENKVPLVVVFTKYDELRNKWLCEAQSAADEEDLLKKAEGEFDTECLNELRDVSSSLGILLEFKKVSDKPEDLHEICDLVTLTRQKLEGEIWRMWVIAQQVNLREKMDVSLKSAFNWIRRGKYLLWVPKITDLLLVFLHKDIVKGWHFRNSDVLQSNDFRRLVRNWVERIGLDNMPQPPQPVGLQELEQFASLLATISPTVAAPVAAASLGILVVQQAVQRCAPFVRRVSAYSIGLLCVMKELFGLHLQIRCPGLHKKGDGSPKTLGWREQMNRLRSALRGEDEEDRSPTVLSGENLQDASAVALSPITFDIEKFRNEVHRWADANDRRVLEEGMTMFMNKLL